MKQARYIGTRFALVFLIALISLAAACGNGEGTDDGDDVNDSQTDVSNDDGPDVSEDAPDPINVDADDVVIIDEWQEAGVPRFRDGEVLDFEPHASQVENGGTLLLDGLDGTPEEIIGFYRGALQALGWEERRVEESEMTAQNDVASLLVTVNVYDDQTLIMMILTDSIGSS